MASPLTAGTMEWARVVALIVKAQSAPGTMMSRAATAQKAKTELVAMSGFFLGGGARWKNIGDWLESDSKILPSRPDWRKVLLDG